MNCDLRLIFTASWIILLVVSCIFYKKFLWAKIMQSALVLILGFWILFTTIFPAPPPASKSSNPMFIVERSRYEILAHIVFGLFAIGFGAYGTLKPISRILKYNRMKERELWTPDSQDELYDFVNSKDPSKVDLKELDGYLAELKKLKIRFDVPKILTQDKVTQINLLLDDSIFEADCAVDELKDGSFGDTTSYSVDGIPENADFSAFRADIISRVIRDNWDYDKHILELVKKHFPHAEIKKSADDGA